jgi:hypothetical protein
MVGFLVALIIIVWVVGSLFNLYVHRFRHKDDDPQVDAEDVRRRVGGIRGSEEAVLAG